MPVKVSEVQEFIDSFKKDAEVLRIPLNTNRTDPQLNNRAADKSNLNRSIYGEKSLQECWLALKELHVRLQSNPITSELSAEEQCLVKYLPLFSSGCFDNLINTLKTKGYTDPSENSLWAMTAIILAHHSNAESFHTKPQEFANLADTWLEALLTCNCRYIPKIPATYPNPHSNFFYSTDRNLCYFQAYAKQLLNISQQFKALLHPDKWRLRVITFDAIMKILPGVVADHNFITSSRFSNALTRLEGFLTVAPSAAAPADEPAPAYSEHADAAPAYEPPSTGASLAAAADAVPPVYLTLEQQAMQQTGHNLMQAGLETLAAASGADTATLLQEAASAPPPSAAERAKIERFVLATLGVFGSQQPAPPSGDDDDELDELTNGCSVQ